MAGPDDAGLEGHSKECGFKCNEKQLKCFKQRRDMILFEAEIAICSLKSICLFLPVHTARFHFRVPFAVGFAVTLCSDSVLYLEVSNSGE